MSDWRTFTNYNSHPGAPPRRDYLKEVTTGRMTLARMRTIQTDSSGTTIDSGWGAWGYVNVAIGIDWLLPGYSSTAGSSWVKTEVLIETAAGIGRPWNIIWRNQITNTIPSAVTYSTDEDQLLMPGDAASRLYDAANNTILQFESAAVLIIADGL